MRYFLDSEFVEDGRTIDLISIGIVAEDGREYYAQSVEFDETKASDWVREHVFSELDLCPSTWTNGLYSLGTMYGAKAVHAQGACGEKGCPWRTRAQLKRDILSFMDIEKYSPPELWADYAAYDHVAFCQLFGTMMDLPEGFPMYSHDLQQWCDALGNPELPEQEVSRHHALADARWNRLLWQTLSEIEREEEGWTPEQLDYVQAVWNDLAKRGTVPPAVLTTAQAMRQLRRLGLLKESQVSI